MGPRTWPDSSLRIPSIPIPVVPEENSGFFSVEPIDVDESSPRIEVDDARKENDAKSGASPTSFAELQRRFPDAPGRVTGAASYTVFDTMVVNHPEVIRLLISPSATALSTLRVRLEESGGRGKVIADNVPVGRYMRAEFIRSADFRIEPATTGAREMEASTPTQWVWTVTPLSHGRKVLVLVLSIVSSTEENAIERSHTNISREILVIPPDSLSSNGETTHPPTTPAGPGERNILEADPASSSELFWTGIAFLGLLLIFLMAAFFVRDLPPQSYTILRVFSALAAALAGSLIAGQAVVQASSGAPQGTQWAVSGSAGFALFILIWMWFPERHAGGAGSRVLTVPGGPFAETVDALVEAEGAVARFEGFTDAEYGIHLRSRKLTVRDLSHALELLRDLAPNGKLRHYDVSYNDAVYLLRVRSAEPTRRGRRRRS